MKIITGILALAVAGGGLTAAPISKTERQRIVAHLEMTESWLADEVLHLSPAQLRFRAAPGTWSVLDTLEHLTLSEPVYWKQLQDAVKAPASSKKGQLNDADILWYGIDRSEKQKTEPSKEPKARLSDAEASLETFRKLHAEMLQFARTTDDDLRSHFVESEGVDAYQWLLGISTHEQRHILQIREIKADADFPKK